jgi:hypothetical protein
MQSVRTSANMTAPRARLIVVTLEQLSPNTAPNALATLGLQLNCHAAMVARPPLIGIGIEGTHG